MVQRDIMKRDKAGRLLCGIRPGVIRQDANRPGATWRDVPRRIIAKLDAAMRDVRTDKKHLEKALWDKVRRDKGDTTRGDATRREANSHDATRCERARRELTRHAVIRPDVTLGNKIRCSAIGRATSGRGFIRHEATRYDAKNCKAKSQPSTKYFAPQVDIKNVRKSYY